MYSVSIIIPNFNGKSLLEKNLQHVIAAAKTYQSESSKKVEVIIVDDFSTDDSVDFLNNIAADSSLPIHIVEKKKNEGFAATVNDGVSHAKGEIVLLLNTDVVPEENFLQPLLTHFKDSKVFGVGCLDKSIEAGKVVERGRGIGTWDKGLLIHANGTDKKNTTLWLNGGSSAIRRSLWNKFGGFRTVYNPFYWEDIDLSYQAQKSGYSVLFERNSIVTHMHEEGVIRKKFKESYITTIAYRNQLLFAWMNITDADLLKEHLLYLPYHILSALLREDFSFLSGLFRAVLLLFSARNFRKNSFSDSVKSDKDVTSIFVDEMKIPHEKQ